MKKFILTKTIMPVLFMLIFFITSITGCDSGVNRDFQGESKGRKWTIMVYMAADNDLEFAAMADFNEMEAVRFAGAPVTVLVLLDRSPDYETSDGNWTDTRVYEIKTDPGGLSSAVVSARLDCPELGIKKDTETELNTSDPAVLSKFIDFSKRVYPAERYALFIWGHGTGWRSNAINNGDAVNIGNAAGMTAWQPQSVQPQKAFAIDDSQSGFMRLSELDRAVAGKNISVIGFDTCYAALLEIVYQIRDDAELFVGSEGAIPSTGWDYQMLLDDFLHKPDLSVSELGNSIQYQFSRQYGGINSASITQVSLPHVNNLFIKFNEFAGVIADTIDTKQKSDLVLSHILQNTETYHFNSFPCDLYAEIDSLCETLAAAGPEITGDQAVLNKINDAASGLDAALSAAVISSWTKNDTTNTARKLGVHIIPLYSSAVPAAEHDSEYFRGGKGTETGSFVEDSQNWAPNVIPQTSSLLDKLFYWQF